MVVPAVFFLFNLDSSSIMQKLKKRSTKTLSNIMIWWDELHLCRGVLLLKGLYVWYFKWSVANVSHRPYPANEPISFSLALVWISFQNTEREENWEEEGERERVSTWRLLRGSFCGTTFYAHFTFILLSTTTTQCTKYVCHGMWFEMSIQMFRTLMNL